MQNVITIGREYGSGGRLIAKKLAERLSVPFYDKKLIELAAQESGLSVEYISQAEQKRTSSFLYNLYFSTQNLPLSDQVFIAESEVIRRVASEGPCVIVGRCADYVLRNRPGCVHVFVYAPIEFRMERVRREYGIGEGIDVRAMILRNDKTRASYYNYFTSGKWGRCQNYDLSINSALGIDCVVDVIASLADRGNS